MGDDACLPRPGFGSPSDGQASSKPAFLQSPYTLGTSPSMLPPKLPQDQQEPGSRGSPKVTTGGGGPQTPRTPLSARAPSPRHRKHVTPGSSPSPRHSRGASAGPALDCTSGGLGSTGSLASDVNFVNIERPNTGSSHAVDESEAKRLEMLEQGYLPTQQYVGIMALNRELREQNKKLHEELVTIRVEHERLRMEEAFLRDCEAKAG
mmetsp:Transcript_107481/g.213428  ORF Transcript_107481/g.213428 Transcript_107481/m.213428 type:complete len:207 (+) Transcript_107481:96-716(+)